MAACLTFGSAQQILLRANTAPLGAGGVSLRAPADISSSTLRAYASSVSKLGITTYARVSSSGPSVRTTRPIA
jgi:hypothetical protein